MESPLILDMAIHTFDQARFITGADPVSVYCHEFNPPGSWYKEMQPRCVFSNFPTDLCSVIGAHGVPREFLLRGNPAGGLRAAGDGCLGRDKSSLL